MRHFPFRISNRFPSWHTVVVLTGLLMRPLAGSAADEPVDYASQIKPLLSDRCFVCHGPDTENRQAGLRLDLPEGIVAPLESDPDARAVVPGNVASSRLVQRIMSNDADDMMPPSGSKLSLSADEKELIARWVREGAKLSQHWSFSPIVAPQIPVVKNPAWCSNPIDFFIAARCDQAGLSPNDPAAREAIIRRATFDLTGLPPTIEEIDAFLADDSDNAYERVIDRLLASDSYGERMATEWLDVARYSDTYGYQVDRDRFVWPWRDWVIGAFNRNLPFDDFITEQLAGDLLPNPTKEQILATTFNRLHGQKVEGGSVPEEFRVEYVADRTQTVGTAFLGLTMECCRCHDHKYDPITQREYYQLFSYFNNIDEAGLYSYFTDAIPTPTLRLTTDEQERHLAEATAAVEEAERRLVDYLRSVPSSTGEGDNHTGGHAIAASLPNQLAHLDFEDGAVGENKSVTDAARGGKVVKLTGDHGIDTGVGNFPRWQPFSVSLWLNVPKDYERAVVFHRSRAWTDAGSRGYELLIEGGRLSAALIHFYPGNAIRVQAADKLPLNTWTHVSMTWDGSSRANGLHLWVNGEPAPIQVVRDNLYKNITGGGGDTITIGERFRDMGLAGGMVDDFRVFDRELTKAELATLYDGLASAPGEPAGNSAADSQIHRPDELRAELQSRREALCRLQDSFEEIMVMRELPEPRPAFLLTRGAYDAHGEPVTANVPASLPPLPGGAPNNRLGFARWLTSPQHPLTARVAVNRYWQLCFGNGLVRTPEDFGSQGANPTHPLLLDWLAADFRENGWDVKRLLKQIMMSSTYRQSSAATAENRRIDPDNLWLSRAPVYRLPAEMLRDNALAVSGLLHNQIGGPPAKPYELEAAFKPSTPDTGAGLHRRSLYTYWKQTAPAPMMTTLDAAKREVCRMRRERTSSPLQSLVVINSPQFIEAARILADRLIRQHGNDEAAIVDDMFRRLTARHPDDTERDSLLALFEQQQRHFADNQDAAKAYLAVGEAVAQSEDSVALAAWTSVANTLFAYDGCMMRR
ncbi:MAG: DUF1553 domain-containing protein [Planctomycetaceae bacterium]